MSKVSDDKTEKWIVLNAIVAVKATMLEEVKAAIEEVLPILWPDANYLTEDLCGPEIWEVKYPTQHTVVGMIVGYCVRHELLPLVRVVCKHEYPRLYRLK